MLVGLVIATIASPFAGAVQRHRVPRVPDA